MVEIRYRGLFEKTVLLESQQRVHFFTDFGVPANFIQKPLSL
jgi:hypothetical protein